MHLTSYVQETLPDTDSLTIVPQLQMKVSSTEEGQRTPGAVTKSEVYP